MLMQRPSLMVYVILAVVFWACSSHKPIAQDTTSDKAEAVVDEVLSKCRTVRARTVFRDGKFQIEGDPADVNRLSFCIGYYGGQQ